MLAVMTQVLMAKVFNGLQKDKSEWKKFKATKVI